jgi:hypothetical protein
LAINYEVLKKRRQEAEFLIYICLVEDAREAFREMGFDDAVLEIAYDRVDVIGKEIGKMWIDITKLDKKIEKIMKNEGGEE